MLGCTGAGKKCELAGLCLTKHSPNFFLGFLQIICLGEKSHPGTFFFFFLLIFYFCFRVDVQGKLCCFI